MTEEWRPIVGHPTYEVSSLGGVRRTKTGRKLRPVELSTRYLGVTLEDRIQYLVHRLVARAFIGPPRNDQHANHKNGVRADNRAENLEWCSPSENVRHAFRTLGRKNPFQGRFSAEHPTSKAIVATSIETGEETRYASAMDAVRAGFDSSCISRCVRGDNAYHRGYRWRYAEPQ